jgi:hypothetical protein
MGYRKQLGSLVWGLVLVAGMALYGPGGVVWGQDATPGTGSAAGQTAGAYVEQGLAHSEAGEYAAAVADYQQYERLTGRLEPFMVEQIAEMKAGSRE